MRMAGELMVDLVWGGRRIICSTAGSIGNGQRVADEEVEVASRSSVAAEEYGGGGGLTSKVEVEAQEEEEAHCR